MVGQPRLGRAGELGGSQIGLASSQEMAGAAFPGVGAVTRHRLAAGMAWAATG